MVMCLFCGTWMTRIWVNQYGVSYYYDYCPICGYSGRREMTIILPEKVCNCYGQPKTTGCSWWCPVHGTQTVILNPETTTGILEGK